MAMVALLLSSAADFAFAKPSVSKSSSGAAAKVEKTSASSTSKSTHAEKSRPTILEVMPGQIAEKSGIKPGDKIICAGDQLINRAEEFIRQVHLYKSADCKIILKRGNETITKTIQPNADGRIGVRISDMTDAIVSKTERNGAVTCKSSPKLQSLVNGGDDVPLVTSLKPGTAVKVLYEEPMLVTRTGKHTGICKIRLEAKTQGMTHDEFDKGDWFTCSMYLTPSRIPPGATTKDKPVTIEQAESLKAGMTLAAVRGLLGSSGSFVSRDRNINGVVGQTIIWQNPDGTNLCCNFENDRLVYKSAFLLK